MAAPIRSADLGNAILEELSDGKWATSENIAARVMDRIPPEALSRAIASGRSIRSAASWIICKTIYNLYKNGTVDKRKMPLCPQEYSIRGRHIARRAAKAEKEAAILEAMNSHEWQTVSEITEAIKLSQGASDAWIDLQASRHKEASTICFNLFKRGVIARQRNGRVFEYSRNYRNSDA